MHSQRCLVGGSCLREDVKRMGQLMNSQSSKRME